MAGDRALGLTELAQYGFTDLGGTIAKLEQLVSMVGDPARSAFAALSAAQDPDLALNTLLFLAEKDRNQVKKLLKRGDSADRLCRVIGASSALGDFLNRHPDQLLLLEKQADHFATFGEMTASIDAAVSPHLEPLQLSAAWISLRKAYRGELLKIAARDVTADDAEALLPEVAAALADVAGAAIEVAIKIARAELSQSTEHGTFSGEEVSDVELSVIAMGKCGARELNYISDVDVIYVAESRSGADQTRMLEIATKLATRMMRAIDATANEPMLWQVDANLRPEGKSGALVRTLDSHIAYYERWAESWEFQALLKARPLAGSFELGERYVGALAPKVWASATRDGFVESVQKMRQRVTDNIPAAEVDLQIKLGPGGLRDVEFTVQLLQLVHGRTDELVRQRDTLSALAALAAQGYVGRGEAATFAAHYRFLRTLEHRIQLSQLRRTHLLPTSETAQRALARAFDRKLTAEGLVDRWERVKAEVRTLHQKLFYRPLLSAVSRLEDPTLSLSDDHVQDRLRAIGFSDTKGAITHIAALTAGLSRRAAIQRQLLPVLLQWFGDGANPDTALLAFRRLSEDLGDSPWYLRMLRDTSGAAERMTQVLSNSQLATTLLEKIPEAAAWFDDLKELQPVPAIELDVEFDALSSRHVDSEAAAAAMRQVRRRETLRLAVGAVLGELNLEQITRGLSELTQSYLRAIVSIAMRGDAKHAAYGDILDFGIVAMGRFGGEELGFGSDADIMYVYREVADREAAQKAAETIVAEVKRLSADQLLEFEIDLDLRPEGKNGPVARSLDSYASYYERWSDTWEAQALLRARPIAGSASLQADFTELINKYRYPKVLEERAVTEIRRIKARVETERLPQGADPKRHLKLGRGSLSDVEWLVQLMQLTHGAEHPDIRTPRTLEAIDACEKVTLIDAGDAELLRHAWILASRVRSASVLWANKRVDVLPTDRRQLEGMARILEYPKFSAGVLEEDYLSTTRRARAVFERLFYGFETEKSGSEL